MEYRQLGKSGVLVSPLCLGTMNFGWHTEEQDSFDIMDKALDIGINYFDTADVYGWANEKGLTEEIIGRWLAKGEGRRDAIVLATKVYNHMDRSDRRPEPNRDQRKLSAMKIIRHCEDSLKRLKTDRIDIFQMHHVDRNCPVEEVWEAMDTLKKQGKIVYAASSNFAGWDIAKYNEMARSLGMVGLVSEQSIYNLNKRMIELEVIPACRDYGMGLIPWSPLEAGLLAGVLEKEREGRRSGKKVDQMIEEHGDQLKDYEDLCKDIGEEPAIVALAWLLNNPVVTAPIIGPRTMEQLTSSEKATGFKLDQDTLEKLDEIWPGPGGESPEAYAW
jgi:aryl-alcohol dehydrogenase-like predicted oxidoreductase